MHFWSQSRIVKSYFILQNKIEHMYSLQFRAFEAILDQQ